MSLLYTHIFTRIFCLSLVFYGIGFCTLAVHAQVPANNPLALANGNQNTSETTLTKSNRTMTQHTTVKLMPPLTLISFGTIQDSANVALLEMKGNGLKKVK